MTQQTLILAPPSAEMGGAEKKKNERNAGDFAERKKKKRKIRRKDGAAIAKICEASKEQQVAPSLNVVLNCTDSASAITQKEKQSLLAWVEMGIEPQCSDNPTQDSHGDIEIGFVKGSSVDRSSNGHTTGAGNVGSNGVAFTAAHENGACDHLSNVHACKADHEGHVCGNKSSSNGHNCQSTHHTDIGQSFHEGLTHAVLVNCKKCFLSKDVNGSRSVRSSTVPNSEISAASHMAHHGSSVDASRSGEIECCCLAGATNSYQRGLSSGHARSSEGNSSCQALDLEILNNGSLPKENEFVSSSNFANPHNNKRKREDDKVLKYVLKRSIVVHPSPFKPLVNESRTTKTVVIAWGRNIPVTLTSEACTIEEWISSQSGNLFGLDVEWRPNRAKGEKNKVALLQLCNESECLIIQMLFLDKKPQALRTFLSDPSKTLAGVGVLADGNRLLHDYGLECQGGIELTTLAVERLKRDELRHVGLKVLVQEVLGLKMDKPKKVTLSNWAKVKLDPAQINYACMDAWASFALSRKLLLDL